MAANPKYAYRHLTSGTTLVKNGTGTLATIIINKVTTGTITITDGTSTIGIIAAAAPQQNFVYGGAGGTQFGTQLQVALSATEDITVIYE